MMAESSFIWDVGGGGDASPHTEAEMAFVFNAIAGQGGIANAGILWGLEPESIAGATQIRIGEGWGIVDGHPYNNDEDFDFTPATPIVGTTGRRTVLRCSWAAQTVRIVELSSADGTAAIPSLTQVSGTTYEIPLCRYTVATDGTIAAFADERVFASLPDLSDLLLTFHEDKNYFCWGVHGAPTATEISGIGVRATTGTTTFASMASGLWQATGIHSIYGSPSTAALTDVERMIIQWRGSLIAAGTSNTSLFCGFSPSSSSAVDQSNIIAFRALAGGNVFAVCDSGGVETAVDLGFGPSATIRSFKIEATLTEVIFSIDGDVVATITTNIPTTASRPMVGTGNGGASLGHGPMIAWAKAA